MSELDVVKLLKNCCQLARRLSQQNIEIILTDEEKKLLAQFDEVQKLYSARDLRFMSEKAGLKPFLLGMLKVRLSREQERQQGVAKCVRCGADKYQGHHYLCQTASGTLVFPNINDKEMRAVIERVTQADSTPPALASARAISASATPAPAARPLLKNFPLNPNLVS